MNKGNWPARALSSSSRRKLREADPAQWVPGPRPAFGPPALLGKVLLSFLSNRDVGRIAVVFLSLALLLVCSQYSEAEIQGESHLLRHTAMPIYLPCVRKACI